jgi:hypothetical protein
MSNPKKLNFNTIFCTLQIQITRVLLFCYIFLKLFRVCLQTSLTNYFQMSRYEQITDNDDNTIFVIIIFPNKFFWLEHITSDLMVLH